MDGCLPLSLQSSDPDPLHPRPYALQEEEQREPGNWPESWLHLVRNRRPQSSLQHAIRLDTQVQLRSRHIDPLSILRL
ncbi:hypothetical protein PsW64_05217 [Pseudovibrio sp. W64]|nr:hypothetical protein PsW64_05217 [Pseudovibrio sp. W64]